MAHYRPILRALQLGETLPVPTDIALKWPCYHLCFEPAIGTDTPAHRQLLASPWSIGEYRHGTYTAANGNNVGYSVYFYRIPPQDVHVDLSRTQSRHISTGGDLSQWLLEEDSDSATLSISSLPSLGSLSTDDLPDVLEKKSIEEQTMFPDYATSRPIDIPHDHIAVAAYYLAEKSGFQRDPDDCWFSAIRQLGKLTDVKK